MDKSKLQKAIESQIFNSLKKEEEKEIVLKIGEYLQQKNIFLMNGTKKSVWEKILPEGN